MRSTPTGGINQRTFKQSCGLVRRLKEHPRKVHERSVNALVNGDYLMRTELLERVGPLKDGRWEIFG